MYEIYLKFNSVVYIYISHFISRCPIYSGCKFNTEINHAYVGFVDFWISI